MRIGQAGKRAQQFSSQQQRRHTVQYAGGSPEPLVQRTPTVRRTTLSSVPQSTPVPEPSPDTIQRTISNHEQEGEVAENTGTSAIHNPNRGENNSQRIGRSSDTANVGGESEKQLNPEVIADRVYEILLRENRDYKDRTGQRIRRY